MEPGLNPQSDATLVAELNDLMKLDHDAIHAYKLAMHADVTSVLARAAEDEARHYAWALETLEDLGVDFSTGTGRAQEVFETGHARFADVAERAETAAFAAGERARRSVGPTVRENPPGAAALVAGLGFVAAVLFGTGRRS